MLIIIIICLFSNIFNLCCNFNAEIGACELDNFITVYYKEKCTYPNGFNALYRNVRVNKIKFINYKNSNYSDKSELNILANSKLDIKINIDIVDLASFFSTDNGYDYNILKARKLLFKYNKYNIF